ncbi:hypothetical protein RUA4292_02393 [Ruegeria atlantica]|uniref:Uncharacterized protein n=1 Tax=Ruegeria atlantica TaxID=81569 RepID=A0A0P1EE85_9RHOB|nr:hypothetical protein RUA4292_02393 [Ruegeria atlantica]
MIAGVSPSTKRGLSPFWWCGRSCLLLVIVVRSPSCPRRDGSTLHAHSFASQPKPDTRLGGRLRRLDPRFEVDRNSRKGTSERRVVDTIYCNEYRRIGAKLTGHNHYPWCTCGWCVGGGNRNGGVVSTAPVAKPLRPVDSEYEKQQASLTLKGYGATSYSRCFVNPNASCPVCGQPVYFYANEHGSRVFFDELGKPWTKHPCTDNGRTASGSVRARPSRRPGAEIKEILTAEQKIDQRILPLGRKARRDSWKLAVVVEVHFADFRMEVQVEDLSSQNHQKHRFFIYCDQPLLAEGDLVSRRRDTFSFLHPLSLEDIEVAERQGFEPWRRSPAYTLSRRAPSTTRPPLRAGVI